MPNILTGDFKSGVKLLIDQTPYSIVENIFVKPGKGQGFNRVKLKNLQNGRIIDKTFKSGESVELADVMELNAQYLYSDDDSAYFMLTDDSYEQLSVDNQTISDVKIWLKEELVYTVVLWNSQIISVTPPNFVELEVTHTEAGVKGDTVTGGNKPLLYQLVQ